MKKIIDHDIISSFKEFLSYSLLNDLEAFRNVNVPLYATTPARRFAGKDVYGSPFAQWVYDSSIAGANIPSGVGALNRGVSGLSIDFKNGRVLVNSGVPITGSIPVSIPDFNIYVTTTSAQKIFLENKFEYAPYLKAPTSAIKADSIIAPCIFVSYTSTENVPFQLGGVESTNFSIQVAVFADNLHHLMGVQKVIRDMSDRVFPTLSLTPFNELNDLKYGYWDYTLVQQLNGNQENLIHINDTSFRILDLDYVNEKHPNILVGLGNVSISKFRRPETVDEVYYSTPFQNGNEIIFYQQDTTL
jgi:hypothetical protein